MKKYNFLITVSFIFIILSCEKRHVIVKRAYYDNGNIAKDIIKLSADKNYVVNYNKNGCIESKGILREGKKIGWWLIYENSKVVNKCEYIVINNKEYLNQNITYDSKNKIINDKSDFFSFKIPDTIDIGQTKVNIFYNKLFDDNSDLFICVGYDINEDFDNLKTSKIDSFYSKDYRKGWFGLRFDTPGKKTIRGFIYERKMVVQNNLLGNKDSSSITIYDNKKYFEKAIYVK